VLLAPLQDARVKRRGFAGKVVEELEFAEADVCEFGYCDGVHERSRRDNMKINAGMQVMGASPRHFIDLLCGDQLI